MITRVCTLLTLLLAPAAAFAQQTDPSPITGEWDGRFSLPGVSGISGTIFDMERGPNGEVYMVGTFGLAGGLEAYGVAMWDGSTWHTLGEGESGGIIQALAVADDGTVYIGGRFEQIRGVEARGIAKWDGTVWSPVGGGFENVEVVPGQPIGEAVTDLAFGPDGQLYAAGFLTSAGGVTVNNLAMWDGAAWSDAGNGFFNNTVTAIAVSSEGRLYAGGGFTFIDNDGNAYWGLASGQGGSWRQEAHLLGIGGVADIAVSSSGAVYVGGAFTTYDPDPEDNESGVTVGRMIYSTVGGGSWQWFDDNAGNAGFIKDGGGANINGIRVMDETVYFMGEFDRVVTFESQGVVGWDGSGFFDLGGPDAFGGIGYDAVQTSAGLYVGGLAAAAGNLTGINNIARWIGDDVWAPLGAGLVGGPGLPAGVSSLNLSAEGHLLAAGVTMNSAGGRATKGAASWNGNVWDVFPSAGAPQISRIVTAPDGTIYGSGIFPTAVPGQVYNVGRWTGEAWEDITNFTLFSPFFQPQAMAVDSRGRLFVSSLFTTVNGQPVSGGFQPLAMYDNGTWSIVADINVGVDAIVFDDQGHMYIGGPFDEIDGQPYEGIAKWDGTAWNAFGRGLDDRVTAIALDPDGTVYAGGEFERAWPESPFDFTSGYVNYVAKWDSVAQEWLPMASGLNDHVNALAVGPDGVLYAGGDFSADSSGVLSLSHVAAWDTTTGTWNALGDGTDQPIAAMVYDPAVGVYFGGAISRAGTTASSGIALWRTQPQQQPTAVEPVDDSVPTGFALEANYPNPFNPTTTLPFSLERGMHVRLTVYDLLGRAVATVVDGTLSAGRYAVPFDASTLASGIYLYRLEGENLAQQRTMLLLK